MKKIWLFALFIALLSVVIFIRGLYARMGSDDVEAESSSISGNFMRIPLSNITNDAKWYEYNSGGVTIKFFVVKANDGSIKTAFDACDVCYRTRKGYRQDGNYMVCNNCGNRYPISSLGRKNKVYGGCWSGYLPSFVDRNYLIIKITDIERGRWRFA